MPSLLHKPPVCPLCFERMRVDPCRDGFLCESPHGTRGRVFVGYEDVLNGSNEVWMMDQVPWNERRT